MCDTLVALGNVTRDGATLFAKNSDREPNEAHHIQLIPAADHPPGSMVQCTYIQIPQAAHTQRVLLAKPFWMWGAEMGVNEQQVAIGNEAVFTRVPYEKGPGLTGMDLLRLGLERACTADDALRIITDLISEHGQGGNCGLTRPFFYHNSFLIADPERAWILETAGRQWAARRVREVGTISNAITIRDRWDEASPDLIHYAVSRKWCSGKTDFDFGRCYSDPVYTRFSAAQARQRCTLSFLQQHAGQISELTLMSALRQHNAREETKFRPDRNLLGAGVCMHAGFGPVRINQTTGSMISNLSFHNPVNWVTATAAPCTSLFKPVWIDADLPDMGAVPKETFDETSLWWRHERLHRSIIPDYPRHIQNVQLQRDELEVEWVRCASGMKGASAEERSAFTAECFRIGDQMLTDWLGQIDSADGGRGSFYSRAAWKSFNARAGMPE